MAAARPASLKVRALQWLAQREHSPQELRAKLLRLATGARPGPDAADSPDIDAPDPALGAADVEAVIDWLQANGHLSGTRFVESRVHARQSRFGNQRIQHELRQHGLTADAATQQALRDSELDRAREVWRRKYESPAPDAAGRVRQMRFLIGRGFSPEVVRRVVRGTEPADD